MKRIATLLLPLALTLSACDDGSDVNPSDAARVAEDGSDAPAAPNGDLTTRDGHGHHGPGAKLDRLCETISCTADQRAGIEKLVAGSGRPEHADADSFKAANEALATAFKSDRFDAAALTEYHAAVRPDKGEMKARATTVLVGLHDLLTPEQRGQVADMIAEHGPRVLGGHGHGHGDWKGKGKWKGKGEHRGDFAGKDGGDAHAGKGEWQARKIERMCEPLSCTDAQKTELVAAFQSAKKDRPRRDPSAFKAANEALATAFRGDSFDASAVDAFFASMEQARPDHQGKGDMLVTIHGILTPEQRATVADKILTDGPRAIMGKGGHRGHHRGGMGFRQRGGDGPDGDND